MPERAPDGTSPSLPHAPRKPGLAEAYAALESLLRASPRGRWFLAEYARRNRTAETEMLLEAIASLPQDIAVLIIEHDMDLVFRFAERITVMVSGAIYAEGTPAEIAANRDVRAVYLGNAA